MEKRLILSLLNIYHGDKPRVAASAALTQFVQDYNIGRRIGAALAFSDADRQAIGQLLLSEAGIDAAATHADQWSGLSRAVGVDPKQVAWRSGQRSTRSWCSPRSRWRRAPQSPQNVDTRGFESYPTASG